VKYDIAFIGKQQDIELAIRFANSPKVHHLTLALLTAREHVLGPAVSDKALDDSIFSTYLNLDPIDFQSQEKLNISLQFTSSGTLLSETS
jgi:hypothetical protein